MAYPYNSYGGGGGYGQIQEGASFQQIGQAAQLRGQHQLTHNERQFCNQVVHSSDTSGPYSKMPNPYHDPTNSYDPAVQARLSALSHKYG